jgi:uncharacterized protein (TIGR04255 family)
VPKRLPTKLKAEPLIDAACELRIQSSSSVDLHTVLPGLFFTRLSGVTKVEQLPGFFVPEAIRANPALGQVNSQLVRVHWGSYFITVGTRNVVVGPRLPYLGWNDFKSRILEVFQSVLDLPVVESIERYSIKYINLIQAQDIAQQAEKLDWGITIGPLHLTGQPTQLRVESLDGAYLTIIQVSTGAVVDMVETKEVKQGCVVDVDTLSHQLAIDVATFRGQLADRLDEIRHRNKVVFFDCLKDSTIEEMGPTYE